MPTSEFRKRLANNTKEFSLIVFTVDVVVLVTVLIVLWAMPDPVTPGENCGYMCLQCTTDTSKLCCGCRDEILQTYLEQTFNQKYDAVSKEYTRKFKGRAAKLHHGFIGDVKPVGHLIGEDRDMPSKDHAEKELLPVRKWQRGKNCLLLNGVSLHRGRFHVPVNGFYHVYSAIDFNYQYVHGDVNDTINVESKSPCITHAIYKSNIKKSYCKEKEREMMMMSTHHPYEKSRNSIFSRYDTYIGGDVYLEAGDEIYVKVANISYASSPPRNMFGIHLI